MSKKLTSKALSSQCLLFLPLAPSFFPKPSPPNSQTNLTDLRFDDESIADEQAFLRFRRYVDTVTLSTNLIKTIHFKCRSKYWKQGGRFTVDRWI
jgi:hypothetical protein